MRRKEEPASSVVKKQALTGLWHLASTDPWRPPGGAERVGRARRRSPCSPESPRVSSVSCVPTMGCRVSSAPPQMKRSGPGGPVVELGPMPSAPPAAPAVLLGDSLQSGAASFRGQPACEHMCVCARLCARASAVFGRAQGLCAVFKYQCQGRLRGARRAELLHSRHNKGVVAVLSPGAPPPCVWDAVGRAGICTDSRPRGPPSPWLPMGPCG